MARKGMTGQLNMFDFFSQDSLSGEVEMVSLMPDFEEEAQPETKAKAVKEEIPLETEVKAEKVEMPQETVEKPDEIEVPQEVDEPVELEEERDEQEVHIDVHSMDAVMSRTYEVDGECIEIAYLNYNKVRITRGKEEPQIKVFSSSKEAVDYYVEKMQELEIDE